MDRVTDLSRSYGNNDRRSPYATRRKFLTACICATLLSSIEGCALFGGAFRPSNPESDRRAAEKASQGALDALERVASSKNGQKLVVCFIGVTGGSNAANLSELTRERLEGGSFRLLKKNDVQAALKESGVRANNVFIPTERKKFVKALGENVDFLLAGYIEKAEYEEEGEGASSKRMIYKLELVEVATNQKSAFDAEL